MAAVGAVIYVDKDVQRALLVQLIVQWIAVFSIMFLIFVLAEAIQAGFSTDFRGSLLAALRKNVALFVGIAVLTPCIIYQLMKLSHRFVGPMVSFRRAMRQLAAGEPVQPIHFRENDFWCDIAENFNVILQRMEQTDAASSPDTQAASDQADEEGLVVSS